MAVEAVVEAPTERFLIESRPFSLRFRFYNLRTRRWSWTKDTDQAAKFTDVAQAFQVIQDQKIGGSCVIPMTVTRVD